MVSNLTTGECKEMASDGKIPDEMTGYFRYRVINLALTQHRVRAMIADKAMRNPSVPAL